MITRRVLFVVATLLCASSANAEWLLNNHRSEVTFVSMKAIDVAEIHRFGELAGRIADSGKAVVTIELKSVDTSVEIRDERMQSLLFETDKYPLATIRAKFDKNMLKNMLPGAISSREVEFELDLHGVETTVTTDVIISMISETALIVVSRKPIIINAAELDLSGGVEALRAVANLPSIGNAVPVSFSLVFER